MSQDWQVGDLAVCVDTGPHPSGLPCSRELEKGRIYKVSCTGLSVLGRPLIQISVGAFFTYRFRKIRPDEHEACEEEFSILLKLSKQRVSA